jgi:putative ABC transport system substrate-binding protein
MQRRQFITLAGATITAGPRLALAQAEKVHRLAITSPVDPLVDLSATGLPHLRAFFERLRSHGYVGGRNLLVESFSAEGRTERFASLARDVVSRQPDAILTFSTPLTREFKQATSRIPIVSVTADPVLNGLVESYARPGGNVTGVSSEPGLSLWAKRTAILKEAVPAASHIGFLGIPPFDDTDPWVVFIRQATKDLGLSIVGESLSRPHDENGYRETVKALVDQGAELLVVNDSPTERHHYRFIVDLVEQAKLPTIYPYREFAEVGGLFVYSIDLRELFAGTADQLDQIFRGSQAGDIPIRQPTKFEFLVNLRGAKAIGFTVPPGLLAQADEVME